LSPPAAASRVQKDLALVQGLADALGAQLACSRPLVEAGWLPYTQQIGLSGRTVKPKLIITCGISGAVQFTACMKTSECIIAINTDPDAPIFKVAHYGVVGDLYEIGADAHGEAGQEGERMNYKKPGREDIEFFRTVCPPERVLAGEDISPDYGHDEMPIYGTFMPDVLIYVMSTEEVSKILAYCNRERIAVTLEARAPVFVGAAVATEGGVAALRREDESDPAEVDEDSMTATVEPGGAAHGLFSPCAREEPVLPSELARRAPRWVAT